MCEEVYFNPATRPCKIPTLAKRSCAGQCSGGIPRLASRRLQFIEGRLDATWRAVQAIEVALASFEKDVSDEQKTHFNTVEIVSAR